MQFLRSSWLVLLLVIIGTALFWLRPGGIEGPRPAPVAPEGRGFDHSALDPILAQVARPDGTVDYAAVKAMRPALDHYLGQLRAAGPANAGHRFKTSNDRLAYYLNAYNALMLATVLDHCPIDNVQTAYVAGGLFWRVSFLLGEDLITLSDLEGQIRSVMGADAAVLLAVIKGAKGSPMLPPKAFRGETVHDALAAHARAVLKLPAFVRQEGDTVHLSKIFEWYQVDFGTAPIHWIQQRAPELLTGTPKTIVYQPFDWALNGTCP